MQTKYKATEKEIQKAIGDYLTAQKVFWWRNNTGVFVGEYKGKKRLVRFGKKGSGDIFAIHDGKFISIEVKTPGKKPGEDQIEFIKAVRQNGGRACWVDNIDEFIFWF